VDGPPSITWHARLWKVRWILPAIGGAIAIRTTLLTLHHRPEEPDARFASFWIFIAICVIGVWRLGSYPRLIADSIGVTARNRFNATTVPWDDIAELVPGYRGTVIDRRSGTTCIAEALQKTNLDTVRNTRIRADAVAEFLMSLVHQEPHDRLVTLRLGPPARDDVGFTASGEHRPGG